VLNNPAFLRRHTQHIGFCTAALALALALLNTRAATAQAVAVLFDEDDTAGADYRDASFGATEGNDILILAGPGGNKMPTVTEAAYQGVTSGLLAYRHTEDGSWTLEVAEDGFGTVDFSDTDSVAFYLNGSLPVAGPDLPRFALVDADGRTTARLDVDTSGLIGFNALRSGFQAGSTTDAAFLAAYLDALPPMHVRPGYPEDLRITFADTVLDTSRASIGVPGLPARFKVETAFTGLPLEFSFRDLDGDSTLGGTDEFIDIYTPEAEGPTPQRPTWRLSVVNAPTVPPGASDVYLLAVNNGGIDGDMVTWQRIGVSLTDFGPPGSFDLGQVQAIRFTNGTVATGLRTLWVDYVVGIDRGGKPSGPPPPTFTVQAGDSSIVLRWEAVPGAASTHVYRQTAPDAPFEKLTDLATTALHFADLNVENGQSYTYILRSLGPDRVPGPDSDPVAAIPQAGLPDVFLDLLAETTFDYFWQEANPSNGLIKDRSTPNSSSSIAAVGFGLSAITVGIDREWITREEGRARVRTTLRFFWNAPQSTAPDATGYRGFFYHFLNMNSGRRSGTTELSTIDTALLLAGVLHMKTYFTENDPAEEEIRALSDSIYARVDWPWTQVRPPAISHGWRPESGFIAFDWIGYNEAMIAYILALGSPTHPVEPDAWDRWASGYDWETHYGYSFVVFPPLFGHQYTHTWVDFRGIQDAYMRGRGIDYFENSRRATLAQRAYHIANPRGWPNYGKDEWGLTASDTPGGYRARGAPPAQNDDGTLAPTAPGGSIAFTPDESIAALRHLYDTYPALWGPYGFRDAYNAAQSWFDDAYLGIDQGPILLMIENYRTGRVWEAFMQHAAVRRGLARAGFEPVPVGIEPEAPLPVGPRVHGVYPNPFREQAAFRFTLPAAGTVTLTIHDVLGRTVATLLDAPLSAGEHLLPLSGSGWASGVYFYRLRTDQAVKTGTMVRTR